MSDAFRSRASEDLARLLVHWRTIEFWIKRAEQINGEAVIPAINELRYASRQIFQAVKLLGKNTLNPGECHVIEKRLIIAEQYLLNADHDVCDAIISFFAENIKHLDSNYGVSNISVFFVEYPALRRRIKECYDLIANSRGEYDDRKKNYGDIRSNHFVHILEAYQHLIDAEVSAKIQQNKAERELIVAQGTINFLYWFTVLTGLCTVISLPLAIGLWLNGPQAFCRRNSSDSVFAYICSFAATDADQPANNPSIGATQDAPALPPQPSNTAPRSKPAGGPLSKPSPERKE